jgi:hypothetical protein
MVVKLPPVPWKEVFLAFFLLFAGVICVLFGSGLFSKVDRMDAIPYIILGIICLIPGVYHVGIFILACRKVPGYTFDMLPASGSHL